ncbi:MAG: very short patch repair endonuclease [Micrococcales bacterium]|nr:very short patch repair endonuclease [Micrococcales bacterium]
MQANRSRDTGPELKVRRLLFARGLRYRVNFAPLRGVRRTADIVFPKQHIAVFIDGCFWHSCPEHGHAVATNTEYWEPKLARNRERDRETTAMLETNGWLPVRFWAHEDPLVVAGRVEDLVRRAKANPRL